MLSWLAIIGVIIGIYGVITETVSLGVIFIISLAVFLYVLISFLNKGTKLTEIGIGLAVVSSLLLAYTVCYLFLNIDVKVMLGL